MKPMLAVYISNDEDVLITREVAHLHTSEHEEEDGNILYETHAFFLRDGILTLADSLWSDENLGEFIGLVNEDEDPHSLLPVCSECGDPVFPGGCAAEAVN